MTVEPHTTGRFVWMELTTPDAAQAKTYYSEVFGWRMESHPTPQGEYTTFCAAEKTQADHFGGLMQPPPGAQRIVLG